MSGGQAELEAELDRLCRRVAGAAEVTVDLRNRPDLRRVRSVVADQLGFGRSQDEPLGALLLVVDELVSNAYRHADGPGELRVVRHVRGFMVEVFDDDPDLEGLRSAPASARYGLRLIGQLTLDWGFRTERTGKTVWALVPAQPPYDR
ncbi:ATP-binding protein [Amycolatopsis decaplanina]|uniref:Putative PAS/PAC sensor protein n=1 Tax=Amycolatopsis decaplanina DSM 44594 TaxID=1284240 RepID=M2Z330_9PSEU|nr:ATP-binding protein [Amycolatopsis decaplanina]EME61642.1 putative PAS/PAC sensor protein [Amycolatopsis decaplanina DSM 44594]